MKPFLSSTRVKLPRVAIQTRRSTNACNINYQIHKRNFSDQKSVLDMPTRAKTLLYSRKSGTLTTVSQTFNNSEMPLYGSIMPYILMPNEIQGRPIFAVRPDEDHSIHLMKFPRSSLVVYPLTPVKIAPTHVPIPRVNLTGISSPVPTEELDEVKEVFLQKHPAAKPFMEETEFTFYRLEPTEVYFLGGQQYGRTEMLDSLVYKLSAIDPVGKDSSEAINLLNGELQPFLHLFCKSYGETDVDPTSVFAWAVDSLGFNLLGKKKEQGENTVWLDFRLPFPSQMHDIEEAVDGLKDSLSQLSGKDFGNASNKWAELESLMK